MPKAVFATLLEYDSTIREIVKKLDATHHFIIEEVDFGHVLVEPGKVNLVQQEVDRVLDQNVYHSTDSK